MNKIKNKDKVTQGLLWIIIKLKNTSYFNYCRALQGSILSHFLLLITFLCSWFLHYCQSLVLLTFDFLWLSWSFLFLPLNLGFSWLLWLDSSHWETSLLGNLSVVWASLWTLPLLGALQSGVCSLTIKLNVKLKKRLLQCLQLSNLQFNTKFRIGIVSYL